MNGSEKLKDEIIESLQYVISNTNKELHVLENRNKELQKRNTQLVEENRILKSHLKAIKEGFTHVQIDSFDNIDGINLE